MKTAFLLLAGIPGLIAQDGGSVLVVVNDTSPVSVRIGEYYVKKRSIPPKNVCHLKVSADEYISREAFERAIEAPIGACLSSSGLRERVFYIVTTLGLPLLVTDVVIGGETSSAAVDSELTLLYSKLRGLKFKTAGPLPNPFFGKKDVPFRPATFGIYLVTRLAGYDFEDVKGIIDRSLQAVNRGKFVIDLRGFGDEWLRAAAQLLPASRVVLEDSTKPLYDQRDVIGYASWGSNDPSRKRRMTGFQWAPGGIATELVSTDGRTFERPPDGWDLSSDFKRTGQTLTADYIHEGATAASGHVWEPFLEYTPRPDLLLPAYFSGRNLAESFYLSIPGLSWQNIIVGDPLCRLRPIN